MKQLSVRGADPALLGTRAGGYHGFPTLTKNSQVLEILEILEILERNRRDLQSIFSRSSFFPLFLFLERGEGSPLPGLWV